MGAWQNRYQTPTADALLAGLAPDARTLAEEAVRRIGLRPRPVWVVPWNWTLWMESPERGPVVIVPDPGRLLIAARIARGAFDAYLATLPARGPREPIVAASCVGEAVWLEWTPDSTAGLDAVFRLIRPD